MSINSAEGRFVPSRGRPRSFDRGDALEQAMRVFWQQGYETTTLADLTTAMNINPPSLYAAFGDKKSLFIQAIDSYMSGPGSRHEAMREAPTARRAVEQLLEMIVNLVSRRKQQPGCMVVVAAVNCADPDINLILENHRKEAEAMVRRRIERGIRDGELPDDTDATSLAKFYETVIQGMSIQARDGASRKSLTTVAAAAMSLWPEKKSLRRRS